MPSTPLALQNLNENMTFADIQTAFEKTAKSVARPLVVVLPKLKLESEHDLLDSLFADLDFNVKVDLSAATKSATEQRVSTAFQRASLEFAETKGAPKEAEEEAKEEVVISRPFLAVIRDDESGEWLSVARIQSLVDESVVSFQFI
ncbi:unnamed protein product [Oppiella nova]|uniref:Serpin domain-containing protein n=1 Tax=Oppiella nova TaxID=334625 RepID=A0A7R9QZS9_9ACAR|nr:unnamed protein product [Oppiella nova]CAG2180528.1 unnamed protein product [Oppiella nova]